MTDPDIVSLLKNFADDIKTNLKKDIAANADISVRNHEETRRGLITLRNELHEVKGTVHILWRKVNGPNAPPPQSSGEYRLVSERLEKEKPLTQSVSDHNLDLESLKAQVMVLDKKSDELASRVEQTGGEVREARGIALQVLEMNKEQSASLGIGVSIQKIGDFLAWLKTKQGQRYAATLFAAATSLITALGTSYALFTNRLPAPTDPVARPQSTTVYVAVPVPQQPYTAQDAGSSHP